MNWMGSLGLIGLGFWSAELVGKAVAKYYRYRRVKMLDQEINRMMDDIADRIEKKRKKTPAARLELN